MSPTSQCRCLPPIVPWQPATLLAPHSRYGWRMWEHYWTPHKPGRYTLLCRAIDAQGNIQPNAQQSDRESYVANWSIPVEVKAVEEPDSYEAEFMI